MDSATIMAVLQSSLGQAEEAARAVSGADLVSIGKAFAMAIAIGAGVFGAGLSEGHAAAKAVEGIARNPEAAPVITRTMIIGQAITDSNSIYALVVALVIWLFL